MIDTSQAQAGWVLTVAGLALMPLALHCARRVYPGRNVFFARWGFSHLGLLMLLLVALSQVVPFVPRPEAVPEVLFHLVLTQASLAGCALLAMHFAHKLHPESVAALGLRPGRNLRAAALGAVVLALILPLVMGVAQLWPWLLEALGGTYEQQAVVTGMRELERGAFWAAIAIAVLVAPFLEELLFRGFLQPLLVQNLGEYGGLAVTSLAFAAMHGQPGVFLPLFVLSLALGGVMLRSQRLSACWTLHALFNATSLVQLMVDSGGVETVGGG